MSETPRNKKTRKIREYFNILKGLIWKNERNIDGIEICYCGYKKSNTPPPLTEFKPLGEDCLWGGVAHCHAWFHFTLPETHENDWLTVETEHNGWNVFNPQFIIYTDGLLRQGLDTNHREHYIGKAEKTDIYIYAYIGSQPTSAKLITKIKERDTDISGLYYDIAYPITMLDCLDTEGHEYSEIETHLYRAVSLLDMHEVGSEEFAKSVKEARTYLASTLYDSEKCPGIDASVSVIGHTHIDCAWKWTFEQTREKVQRSFGTVKELMKLYPEYKFMSSQALLYKYLKEEAPELYNEVKELIKAGRWECEGAMWVEADCNLTSGESLVRQVLYAKNFFKDEFGVENRVLWLPDVFGYSAALPQILKKSGIDWFVTSKISWNDMNRMPYDTFRWRGIDGTAINTQFITAQNVTREPTLNFTTYNGNTNASAILGTYKRYSEKNLSNEALLPYGWGDGGGGPTIEYLELARRGEKGIPGCPKVKQEFAGDFLKRLAKKIEGHPELPEWRGELYLEFHRGTYTSIAKNKKNNRYCEFLYTNAEMLSTLAKELFGDTFPKETLHRGWEDILSNQFHDVIPGSSIKEVYDQCDTDYARVKENGELIVNSVKEKIAASLDKKRGYVVFNPHSFEGNGYVKLDGKTVKVKGISPKGYSVTKDFTDTQSITFDGKTVETDLLKVTFDEAYQIVSIYDKENGREVLTKGKTANELRIYADRPDAYDAWEWQEYSRDSYKVINAFDEVETVNDGARFGIKISRSFMGSRLIQTIWFYEGTAKIDFETFVDWHSKHNMLKVAFPVDINSDKATYEVQFGTLERPTHFNTSWDKAKFEVCAHKYADISEGNYGVSILNDCKYGHDIHDGVIQLSLLKAPTDPYKDADMGEHTFTYSIYPHSGRLDASDTVKEAYFLNYPMTALPTSGECDLIPTSKSLVAIDSNHVICETIKEEEKGSGTIIRLYECKNMSDRITLGIGIEGQKASLVNLMEEEIDELEIKDRKISLDIKPFEIVTIKLS
ncbi:MAG: alpha-mannosidase [Ruminococcaceae bacterium]|nr:alpha-mannosidase [Oscillospiraceae bacterium]